MDIQNFAAIYFRGNFCLANIAKINRSRNCIGLQYFSCSIWGSIQYLKDEHLCTQSSCHWWNDKNVFLTFSELEKNGPLIWHGPVIWRWMVRRIDVFGERRKVVRLYPLWIQIEMVCQCKAPYKIEASNQKFCAEQRTNALHLRLLWKAIQTQVQPVRAQETKAH